MSILINKGQRGIIVGKTGSGKTIGAIWQMQQLPFAPVIILDSKIEPAFDTIAVGKERLKIYNSAEKFMQGWERGDIAEYMIVRPSGSEISAQDIMDDCLQAIYSASEPCLVYIDEAYHWHVNGRCGAGLNNLLTRGRSKGISTLLSTQRPVWISRFCFTECERFYIYRLSDERDRKTVGEFVQDFSDKPIADKFMFWYYDHDMTDGAVLYNPVPLPVKGVGKQECSDQWY